MTGTVFWPWSSNVILPTIESRSFTLAEFGDDLLAVRTDLLDRVEDHVHRGIGEGAIGLGRVVVFLRVVLLHEELAARQLLGRRAFAERERAFGQRSEALDEGVGHDARGAVEHRLDAELVHLRADAHADRRQPAEIDHLGIERLDLGELGGEVLLVGGDAEGADDLGLADLGQRLAEIFVVTLAVVGGVVDHRDGLVAELGDQLGVGVVLVDHRAVDAMHLRVLVAIGDVGQHRAPHDHRKAELVIGVDGRDRGRRAIVRGAGDDVLVGRHLGRDLHRHVRLALVVEHDELVFVFRLRHRRCAACTARSAELRPPRPLTETPPVSGPMKPTLTLSLASAATVAAANASAAMPQSFVDKLYSCTLPPALVAADSCAMGEVTASPYLRRNRRRGVACA